ncbi:hypothetical protein [Pontibacter arcticus]|uniref:Uncharacterized protein n=1 Tax=Pontibacter arcticus TaxID=2080288 RepID=A0A364RG26_9BACT|nr:hypothetical protein [Pontibacter arcticus]RAU83234.1 hypothetical protein DP923_08445 [Pontibacter arcticus]
MAGLQADILSEDFLKNFLPETVYLVPEDVAVYTSVSAAMPAPDATPAPVPIVSEEKATPVLPKKPEVERITPKAFDVTGQNRKGIVVLVTLPDHEFKTLPKLEFLQKILTAIGLQTEDVAYVNNISGQIAVFEELHQLLPVNYIISFASRINTYLPHDKFTLYTPVKVADVPVVFSQSLAVIESDVEQKKQLWNSLKATFAL